MNGQAVLTTLGWTNPQCSFSLPGSQSSRRPRSSPGVSCSLCVLSGMDLHRLWPDYEEVSRAVGWALGSCKSAGVGRGGVRLQGWLSSVTAQGLGVPGSGSHRAAHTCLREWLLPWGHMTQSVHCPVSTGFFWLLQVPWHAFLALSPSKTGSVK